MKEMFFCWVFLAVVVVQTALAADEELVVKTTHGLVKGHHEKSYEGRTVTAFEGIPYAKPPVGKLRFKEPQPVEPWNDTLVANKKYTCLQYITLDAAGGTTGDEDCLYLYIYVPRENIRVGENLDVVINIHASGFTFGDPQSWASYEYVMDRDIIYVSFNYRLGILGFLSTQDAVLPGNNGLKDQVAAMRWVKQNIERFGGNPYSITLTGASTGGASVHLHYLSPLSTGLFNRGISNSGTATNTFALSKAPLRSAKKLAEHFKCNTTATVYIVDCLREKPGKELASAQAIFYALVNVLPPVAFGPVIEYGNPFAFLPDHPYKLIVEGRINDCPWVASMVKDDGVAPAAFIAYNDKFEEVDRRWDELAPIILEFNDTANEVDKLPISKAIRKHYFRNDTISRESARDLTRLFTDRTFYVDGIKAILKHAKMSTSPVHYYYFEYYIDAPVPVKSNISVVGHTDDVKLLFRQASNPLTLSDNDRRMKDILLDFVYSYASSGIPTFNGYTWAPLYSTAEPTSYMHIFAPDTIRPERAINVEPLSFWEQLPLLENEKLLPFLTNLLPTLPFFFYK